MKNEKKWKKIAFSDAFEINPKVDLVKGRIYPFINMDAMNQNNRNVFRSEYREYTGSGSKFISDDTLMARITPCLENGKIAGYKSSEKEEGIAFGSTEFIVIRGKKGLTDNTFAYYVTRWMKFRNYAIAQMTGSSGRQRVPVDSLKGFSFYLPPLPTQEQIADILSTLDNKIELNQQMNQTLENMARAIFKSWFVDFEPVIAKMEGRDYPLPAEIMNLFPDELVESELGLIPKGWRVGRLGDDFKITMGQSPPGNTYNEEGDGLPFYQGRKDFGVRFPVIRMFCSTPTRTANTGDSMVSVRAPIGDVNLAPFKCCIGRGVAAVRYQSNSSSYTYYSMLKLREHFNQFEAEGTVFGSISKSDFSNIKNIKPPENIVVAFESIVSFLDKKVQNNYHQIETLKRISHHERDSQPSMKMV